MSALIYYTGQDVGVSTQVVDDAGSPATGSVVVSLTVTDPSGAITHPTPVAGLTGAYSAVVPTVTVAGTWRYRWTATGTGVGFASEGQFSVRPLGIEQLVDLASVKAHLNMPATETRQDDELQYYILAAADMARDFCGPFLPETHTQYFSGGTSSVSPDWRPLQTVLSVTEYYGLGSYALTEQDLGSATNAFAYTVDYASGTITRRAMSGEAACFAYGYKNVKVVYTAGRATVPFTVRLGALELIRHLWQLTQQGGRPKFGGAGYDTSDAVVPTGFALPSRVLELWGSYRRPPGIA